MKWTLTFFKCINCNQRLNANWVRCSVANLQFSAILSPCFLCAAAPMAITSAVTFWASDFALALFFGSSCQTMCPWDSSEHQWFGSDSFAQPNLELLLAPMMTSQIVTTTLDCRHLDIIICWQDQDRANILDYLNFPQGITCSHDCWFHPLCLVARCWRLVHVPQSLLLPWRSGCRNGESSHWPECS